MGKLAVSPQSWEDPPCPTEWHSAAISPEADRATNANGICDHGSVNRRRLPWLLSIALIAAGSVTAHSLGYLAFAGSAERGDEVVESSHGLAANVPLVLAILVAAAVVGLLSRIVSVARGRAPGGASVRWFFVLPPLGFAVQEAVERLMHVESFPGNGLHEPAF